MNFLTISGIIIIAACGAIGTYLMYVGGRRDARADSEEAARKIDDWREEVSAAIKQSPTPEASAKVSSINGEYLAWADEFVRNTNRTELEVAEIDASNKQREVADAIARKRHLTQLRDSANTTARPLFVAAIKALENGIAAYNKVSGSHFNVELPEMPHDLYGDQAKKYQGSVSFTEHMKWFVRVGVPDHVEMQYDPGFPQYPVLSIKLDTFASGHGESLMVSIPHRGGPPLAQISLTSTRFPNLKGIQGARPVAEHEELIRTAIQRLIEAQVWVLNKKLQIG